MSTIGKILGAYKGGSPRRQNPNSKITPQPKDINEKNVSMYEGVLQGLYLNNQLTSEDINHLILLLDRLKSNSTPQIDENLSNYIPTFFTPISEMYIGGSINVEFISSLISKLIAILELTPFPKFEKVIKDTLSTGDNIKNAGRVQNTVPKSKIDKSISQSELIELGELMSNKFIHGEITKDNMLSLINYFNHLINPQQLQTTPQSNLFLVQTTSYVEKLYLDNKLTPSNLEYLVASFENTLELTQIEKPTKIIKNKITPSGYKK